VASLDYIVPHQANQRILDAIGRRVGVPIISSIENWGNTSSSSIPITLDHILNLREESGKFSLVAFGGGLTSSAVVGQMFAASN